MTTKITEQNISNIKNASVQWQAVKTSDFTASAGEGYFVNTTGGAITVTLPATTASTSGDTILLKDYARTWGSNNCNIASILSDGTVSASSFSTNGQTITFVYMDGTKGWSLINEDTSSELVIPPTFTAATGGTVSTVATNFKVHVFTGDGNFVVSSVGNAPTSPTGGPNVVDYVVVAGGGGGGGGSNSNFRSGGGGAGGYREAHSTPVSGCYTASPLATPTGVTVTAATFPITVGGGGSGGGYSPPGTAPAATSGSNSVFSTITSAGGGKGGTYGGDNGTPNVAHGTAGGSGGGAGGCESYHPSEPPGGAGNTPPVSPPQGNNGGTGKANPNPNGPAAAGGGGGGAGQAGFPGGSPVPQIAEGGDGVSSTITGSSVARAGGGGGGHYVNPGPNPNGGTGGGGDGHNGHGGSYGAGSSASANTGGGGGGASGVNTSGAGGKGIVILRYKFQ